MKKILPIIIILVIAGYFLMGAEKETNTTTAATKSSSTNSQNNNSKNTSSNDNIESTSKNLGSTLAADESYENIKPATDIYSSSDDALKAIKAGAKEYDDIILERFVDIGIDCTWCGEFFTNLEAMMKSDESTEDEKSYYAEIFAISGSIENISTLIDSIAEADGSDNADIFAEALELSVGGAETVDLLTTHLNSPNELLAEASLAAITNHGSLKAVEQIYQHTVDSGDPDGFYSLGIGLGEIIPDDESLPFLTEIAEKKNAYSHLAIKSILNSGDEGLRTVMDILSNYDDKSFDKNLLEDAIDHVSQEDDTESYLKDLSKNSNSRIVQDFANEILDDFDISDDYDEDEDF